MERLLVTLSWLLILFIIILNYIMNNFDSERNWFISDIHSYWREFIIPSEYQNNDFFVVNEIPERRDFYNWVLDPYKKTFFVLKQWKSILDLENLAVNPQWYFDKKDLFDQEDNKHISAFRSLYKNTSDVCTLNRADDITCRTIDINKK